MPCRALEAFRLAQHRSGNGSALMGLNALSGIGGVQTQRWPSKRVSRWVQVLMPCRALEAFRLLVGVWVFRAFRRSVLMPCRALEAFRRSVGYSLLWGINVGLNALSGIGGVQTNPGAMFYYGGSKES